MNKTIIKDILSNAKYFNKVYKAKKIIRKKLNEQLIKELYREIEKRKQNKINNELKKLKFNELVNKNNVTESDIANINKLNAYSLKTLQLIAKVRNINSNMSNKDLIYALIRSKPANNEEKYISYLNKGTNNNIHNEINKIRLQLFDVSPYLNKKVQHVIRKRLYDIEKLIKINRSEKNKLLKELNSISTDLKFKQKNMISDYRDDNYANIDDIEYLFGDIDNYYQPILASSLFNNGYQRYNFRGDPNRDMSVITYFDKIIPHLRVLIDTNRLYEQKIRLDIGNNMVHMSEPKRITHLRSDNVICLPWSNTNDTINQLLTSLYEKYQEDLRLSHASSSFTYESVEECNIHFNKIDLWRCATYIESPKWIKNKKATINPKNTNDVYCFMYAATIALYHDVLRSNPTKIRYIYTSF